MDHVQYLVAHFDPDRYLPMDGGMEEEWILDRTQVLYRMTMAFQHGYCGIQYAGAKSMENVERDLYSLFPETRLFLVQQMDDTMLVLYPNVHQLATSPRNFPWSLEINHAKYADLQFPSEAWRRQREILLSSIRRCYRQRPPPSLLHTCFFQCSTREVCLLMRLL
jgi:hypothetical protein